MPPELDNSTSVNGCLGVMTLAAWEYKAYVPKEQWLKPSPVITKFNPGHDVRILSNSPTDENRTVPIEIHFSDEMNCVGLEKAITFTSATEDGSTPSLDERSVNCTKINDTTVNVSKYTGQITGQIPSAWKLAGKLINVSDGVHTINIANVTTEAGNISTNVFCSSSIFFVVPLIIV